MAYKYESVVNVIGHINPDTDSVCSAIAYANLKSQGTGEKYIPKRAGQINAETQFVLKYFGVSAPDYMGDVRTQVIDCSIIWNSAEYFLQPECGTCDDDEDRKPNSSGIRSSFSDPLRTDPEAWCDHLHHAAGCFRRRCSHDVLLDRCQRNPADHKGTYDSEKSDDRVSRTRCRIWNGSEHGNSCADTAGCPADLRRFRNRSGGAGCDPVKPAASEG